MKAHDDERILASWERNAAQWTAAVREGRIESRALVTDGAVVEAVTDRAPGTVLDVGCGEGWLARALSERGIRVTGVDAVAGLIERAEAAGGGCFVVASHEALAEGAMDETFDVVVCNFSLLGRESVETLVGAVPSLLQPGGALIVQTLHPLVACGDLPYIDGWRAGSWDGFGDEFTDPAPWYFRTLGGWVKLLSASGLRLVSVREPLHPRTGRPASILFTATSATDPRGGPQPAVAPKPPPDTVG